MVDPKFRCTYNHPMSIKHFNPRDSLGFLTWKVSRLATRELAARFAKSDIDVTVEQWRALIPLYKKDGLSQGTLCDLMSQEKTGVCRLVAALEKHGFVRRESCKEDRRVKFLFITKAGRELVDSSLDLAVASREDLVDHIDEDDLAICMRVLWQIIEPTLEADSICPEHIKDSRERS
ncbi:MarR family winged helix-turn-helix transcriptional regulator [Pseudodesulfovibrio piezophilus]|uniref:MarR family winged helix-turn-helix transcriptional regulator n=1 Tax=Pseudodesulfovibrio piezophilus TaxID=879567 RepID=UPI00034DAB25|nr:MarR family transcriptional regulator [Pseudodesulfovibrio piezophilus]